MTQFKFKVTSNNKHYWNLHSNNHEIILTGTDRLPNMAIGGLPPRYLLTAA